MLALLGAAVGLLVAWWGSRALLAIASDGERQSADLGIDAAVLAFTLVVSVARRGAVRRRAGAARIAGRSRVGDARQRVVDRRQHGSRGGQRAPLGKLLIAGQVALSVVLLVGAAMLVRSLRNVQSVDVGMDRDHLVIVDLDINARGYSTRTAGGARARAARSLERAPGVAAVTFSENGIFSGTDSETISRFRDSSRAISRRHSGVV